MRLWLVAVTLIGVYGPANADTAACWWTKNDPSRPDLSCTALTERLLTSLEGATKAEVVRAMGAPGLPDTRRVLRYESNYGFGRHGYSGLVNFTFDAEGRVAVIDASVEAPHRRQGLRLVWNAAAPGCSDFPGSIQRCDNQLGAPRPVSDNPRPREERRPFWLPRWLARPLGLDDDRS